MDDRQRAREQFEAWAKSANMTIHGFNRVEDMWDAWQAATAAQRTAPEGWRIHKDGADIRVTAPHGIPGGMTVRALDKTLKGRLLYALCDALLAARSQGVK